MSKERDITAASYIYKFYTEIQSLNHEYSNYINILLELENTYTELTKASEQEKLIVKQQVQQVRYAAHQTYIHYCSILTGIGKEVNAEVKTLYDKIKNTFMIKREDLELYVTKINAILVNDVIKNLLESSQDLIQEIYKNADTKPTA